ncbi:MAG TPA: DNA polymerase/3'-5' exonuclease PolX [Syntrophorhabdaceae bacterium]|jgi:DNA polymerase (family 10)
MAVPNSDIIEQFFEMADLLEIEGANEFRVRAYRNAARVIASLPRSLAEMVERGEDPKELPGIGQDLAGKIREIVTTGSFSQLKAIEEKLPGELTKLMKVGGLGPKRVKALYRELGVSTLEQLKEAALGGSMSRLPGFGEKTARLVIEEMTRAESDGTGQERIKLSAAEEIARSLTGYLKGVDGLDRLEVAGSYRRRKETVGDLDILAACSADCPIMDRFIRFENVLKVISRGTTRSSVVLRSGLRVDLRLVPTESFGAALHYFTGSKDHNIAVRKMGLKKGLKINEYGVFRGSTQIAGRTEEEVYRQVGLPYIEPELRENWGEIEAASSGRLPALVGLGQIRGDLHAHTKETDGRNTPLQMAEAALKLGYTYLAITDHSVRLAMTHGFDAARLALRNAEIDELNRKLKGIRLLKSIEVDIHEDGSLDLPDRSLEELDLTVCAVHSKFKLSRERQTERILKAMENPYFHILAHPSGRLINRREPYEVDMEQIMRAARVRGRVMEVNAHPDRLDLTDTYCKMAKDMGVKVAISTDAHSVLDLAFMRFGVSQARRGWLGPDDVLNTRNPEEIKELLGGR